MRRLFAQGGGIGRGLLVAIAVLVLVGVVVPAFVVDSSAPRKAAPEASEASSVAPGPQDRTGTGRVQSVPDRNQDVTDANRRLGLHVTSLELREWRRRARNGPYREHGDQSKNSPGDWMRIAERADAFLERPDAGRWKGPRGNNPGGCVRPGQRGTSWQYEPPVLEASMLRDAAFYALVMDSRRHAEEVKSQLLAQAREPGVDFGNRERWCLGRILDGNPGFMIATWLTKHLYAVDYLRIAYPDLFSDREAQRLDEWFVSAAGWMRHDVNTELGELFVDRSGSDYRLTSLGRQKTGSNDVVFLGGPTVRVVHRRYNNRMARLVRFVTLVGIDQGDRRFIEDGKRFVTEYLRFGYYPQGAVSDFERWTEEEPIKGWKYGAETVGAILTIADHLARTGDDQLFHFATSEGALGTEGRHHSGGPKTLETLVTDLLRYVDESFERYGTGKPRHDGDPAYLISTQNGLTDSERINDLQLIPGNWYFNSDYIRSVYTRESPTAPPYPPNPQAGSGDPEGGEAGTYPGVLFMFGQMEDVISRSNMPGV